MNNLLQIFNYQNNKVRVIMIDGEPWFVAKDICDILEISWTGKTLDSIKAAWKGVSKFLTPGGEQELVIISEAAVYKLTFRSRKPEAERFTDWLAEEVIPSIRKTGTYSVGTSVEDLIIAQAQSVKELKAKVSEIELDVKQLKEEQSRRADVVEILPPVNPVTTRGSINQIVRSYAQKAGVSFQEAFGKLYKEFYYRYSIDLKKRAKNKNTTYLDIAEQLGCLDDLLSLAVSLFC